MKGDFSRDTFDPAKHFSRVLMQQGRVQLDADWNEQASILLHYLQTLAADLIGPYGGPGTNEGFKISGDPTLTNDFFIGAGHFYVDGILCELDPGVLRISSTSGTPPIFTVPSVILDNRLLVANDWIEIVDDQGAWHTAQIASVDSDKGTFTVKGTAPQNPVQLRRLTTYRQQQDYPGAQIGATGTFLVYLDVWEKQITAIEDGSVREVALGGPETAERAKVVWQVKVTDTRPYQGGDNWQTITCDGMRTQWPNWVAAWQAQAACQLKVRLKPEQVNPDPCIIAPTSAYRGQENQLYRVEIHAGGSLQQGQHPTFKWSRDNGSIVAAWVGNNEDGAMLVSNTHGFDAGQWIEITTEAQDLLGQPGQFVKIVKVEGGALYLDTPQAWTDNPPMKVRRWDQTGTDGDVPITEDPSGVNWIDLEDGLQIQFQPNGNYRTGDYWLIPARTTGTIEWPNQIDAKGNPIYVAQAPYGIKHHYAPLWIIPMSGGTAGQGTDLRCMFPPAAACPPSG